MLKPLDPLLHSQLRLTIMSILVAVDEADFNCIKSRTQATSGNISVQIDKLSKAGYITVNKSFVDKKTRTACSMTEAGREAMARYVEDLKSYLDLLQGTK